MYDGKVLDMLEVGVTKYVGIAEIKVRILFVPFLLCCSYISSTGSKINAGTQAFDALCLRIVRHTSTICSAQIYAHDVLQWRGD